MELVVGRVGRAHGINGDVAVQVRTDSPDVRFAPGAIVRTEVGTALTVETARWHSGRLLVHFEGVPDRTAAERLGGLVLTAIVDTTDETGDPDEFFDHQLVGLRVLDTEATALGEVEDVLHPPAQDLLAVRTPDGLEVLVPFVAEIVPSVDVPNGQLVVDPPEGLFPSTGEAG